MATVYRGRTSDKYRFIEKYGSELGKKYLYEWLGVSSSGFHDWRNRPSNKRVDSDAALLREIERIFRASRETYGSPRVHAALRHEGIRVGRKRVERLMREANLVGRVYRVTRRQPAFKQYISSGENLRLKLPPPSKPGQLWVGDITYINVADKWLHLAVVMDVFTRRVLGWTLSKNRTVDVSLTALKYALNKRSPEEGCIFHSDRGSEYMAYKYRDELKNKGFLKSVNRPGKCTDNGHMESFFHSLKGELIRGRIFRTESELRYALKGYIDQFYNKTRLHSGLGYMSPMMMEKNAA